LRIPFQFTRALRRFKYIGLTLTLKNRTLLLIVQ